MTAAALTASGSGRPPDGAPSCASTPRLTTVHLVEMVLLTVFAAILRWAAAWGLGEGAPFGPDGTGAEAAVHLGQHLYPLHIEGIRLAGGARTLSLWTGTLTVPLLYLVGHRNRLTGHGAWLAAALPLAVYPSALSAGDAPALFLVTLGAYIATLGRSAALAGGALAMASVAVKPIAAPALMLLLLRPLSLVGAAMTLPVTAQWLEPLWAPRDRSGLLGSWWPQLGNALPTQPADLARVLGSGVRQLWAESAWIGVLLAPIGLLGALFPRPRGAPSVGASRRLAVLPLVLVLIGIAGAFGDRLSPRYYAAALVPITLWAGLIVPRPLGLVLVVPTVALISQVGMYRGEMDRGVRVPPLPMLDIPRVDPRLLFDESSTRDATLMRLEAHRLAETLPPDATYEIRRRPHGREGELAWPLRVARPDVRIVVTD
ncbi:MAG: hypothetical protein CL927_18545 [Deltaproteobacteria bacterium]|nr:hypothetical protein [Deltaproteobacteria bacterium]HCH64653.1 hypothetical protein [Deltaproteobacteria bacterium]